MTDKTFKFVGTSTLNGKTKVRFANDIMRIKVLDKNGHENVKFEELAEPVTKDVAVAHLSTIGFAGEDADIKAALTKASKKYGTPAVEKTAEVA
jgi:hypothetical protein